MAFLFVESSSQYSNISVVQSAVKALKLLFFSAGLISTLLMVKGALIPFLYGIFFPNLVAFWNSFRYFLSSPLYICIIINSVVLLIAATSTFHDHDHDHDHSHDPPPPHWVEAPQPETSAEEKVSLSPQDSLYRDEDSAEEKVSLSPEDSLSSLEESAEEKVTSLSPQDSLSRDEERDDETIDSTWKTIVEGKTKKLTKSESVPPKRRIEDQHSSWKELRKLETFNDGVSIRRLGGLRRDPSVGVDEFNQQVEAFIKKFNEDMRLQRQESDQRFLDMVKRGL